ncbi:MAG: hypothetical protein V4508_12130 [Pseudomonadota bacterium]
MTQITLVLPFALPPPELAPDLLRALQAPALAALLTRAGASGKLACDAGARTLAHEAWLVRAFGLGDGAAPALAAAVMRSYGHDPREGHWFLVHPAHVEISRSHLLMSDLRQLRLSDDHARLLFETARPYFEDAGKTLQYGDAHTWFMRADDWTGLQTASPDAAAGMNLTDWMPIGAQAANYRKLQNEVQMLWFEHRANREREALGLAAVNSFWPWGAANGEAVRTSMLLATSDAPAWISALAHRPETSLPDALFGANEDISVYCDGLSSAALSGDWAAWLAHMQHLEQVLFAPALERLKQGHIASIRLLLTAREASAEFTTTTMAQRAFWRSPTLARLLP